MTSLQYVKKVTQLHRWTKSENSIIGRKLKNTNKRTKISMLIKYLTGLNLVISESKKTCIKTANT